MRILYVDFWSDGNVGDAIMQKELLCQGFSSGDCEIDVISCFGPNQFQLNAFHESKSNWRTNWFPAFFNTFIRLDLDLTLCQKFRVTRLILTMLSLFYSKLRFMLYKITGFNSFLGRFSFFADNIYDVVIFNGRNYRNFHGTLKNFINNEPLLLHQEMLLYLQPSARFLNAGFSIWDLSSNYLSRLKVLWSQYDLNIARESHSLKYCRENITANCSLEHDLSFPYLARHAVPEISGQSVDKYVALSMTHVIDLKNYISCINNLMVEFISNGYAVVLVNQVYLAHESIADLKKSLNFRYTETNSRSILDLCSVYAGASFTISTRMHGSIMSLAQGTPTLSIAYDTGAKWNIISDVLNDYPLFIPGNMKSEDLLHYLLDDQSLQHAKFFKESIEKLGKKEYVCEFIQNIDSKS